MLVKEDTGMTDDEDKRNSNSVSGSHPLNDGGNTHFDKTICTQKLNILDFEFETEKKRCGFRLIKKGSKSWTGDVARNKRHRKSKMKYAIIVAVVFLIFNDLTLPMVHAHNCKSNSVYKACKRYCNQSGCYSARCSRYSCRCSWCSKRLCPPTPPVPNFPRPPGC
ncbi:unnamed protein product [Mytilus coruscus]|uniref:Uncharacterized protein n=1 Tax=Mytilus coruscus TaxID=42192 RepID=A0A6J8DPV9_MYTCO|nr:unnamed protein product [Mytilus coruscus]